MAKGVFVHRADSIYDDFPEERYQFPQRYLKRVEACEGDWIVYYEPRGGGGRMGYTAMARVQSVVPDLSEPGMYLAMMEPGSFLTFSQFVPLKSEGVLIESPLRDRDGSLNRGKIQWAVRPIPDADFASILAHGIPAEDRPLPRIDSETEILEDLGFGEEAAPFVVDDIREHVEVTIRSIPRKSVFRRIVLDAYDNCCAITGLSLINGKGRAEVEAAHIRPVEHNGPDTIRNGIALSGTVHWMFDRGLISLSDRMEILVSRQVNNPDQVRNLINRTGKARVPDAIVQRPHPYYLDWHRENCFKR